MVSPHAQAQAPPRPSRPHVDGSSLSAAFFGRGLSLKLRLDSPVPFRVFTLDAPPRLVLDFAGLDWAGFAPERLDWPRVVSDLRVGRIRPGWSRMVVELAAPLALATAEMTRQADGVTLAVELERTDPADFAVRSGAPPGVWPSGAAQTRPAGTARGAGPITVVIDPGHGGIDPGAVRGGVVEKDLVLAFAHALAASLLAAGDFRVVLTRDDDVFLALADRVALAEAGGADVFLSLHTNVAEEGLSEAAAAGVSGAIAFTLSEAGSSLAAEARAEIENDADALAGLDAFGPRDPVLRALADIAQVETDARSDQLADALIAHLGASVGASAGEPRQSANFEVLRSSRMASVLLEIGFLSNPEDFADMQSPAWRGSAATAVRQAIEVWAGLRPGDP